jgi:hypothetical protein
MKEPLSMYWLGKRPGTAYLTNLKDSGDEKYIQAFGNQRLLPGQ